MLEIVSQPLEQRCIDKKFHAALLSHPDSNQALMELAHLLHGEPATPWSDDEVRLAQGEAYFHIGDYETAIFKWKQVHGGELGDWARKNCGDGYFKLGLFEQAEAAYKNLTPASIALEMETGLALFHLYEAWGETHKATLIMRKLAATDWHYGSVFAMGLHFFESTEGWHDAFELMAQKLLEGFELSLVEALLHIASQPMQETVNPGISAQVLALLASNQPNAAGKLLSHLLKVYKETPAFIEWVYEMHQCITSTKDESTRRPFFHLLRRELMDLVDELLIGAYDPLDVQAVLENVLPVWSQLAQGTELQTVIHSTRTAWGQTFFKLDLAGEPEPSEGPSVSRSYLFHAANLLYTRLKEWAMEKGVTLPPVEAGWLEYDLKASKRIMICGSFNNGKSSFINHLVGQTLLRTDDLPMTSALTMLSYGLEQTIQTLGPDGWVPLSETQFEEATAMDHDTDRTRHQRHIVRAELPSVFLRDTGITFVDTPGFNDEFTSTNPVWDYLESADEVLFLLTAETPFKKTEKQIVERILRESELPVSFVLNKTDYLEEEELEEVLEDVQRKVYKSFGQRMHLTPFSSKTFHEDQTQAITNHLMERSFEDVAGDRLVKVLPRLKQMIATLPDLFTERENTLRRSLLSWKIKIGKIQAMEQTIQRERQACVAELTRRFGAIYRPLYAYLSERIPELLRPFANYVNANTDFDTIHVLLDTQMNLALERFHQIELIPQLIQLVQNWLSETNPLLTAVLEEAEADVQSFAQSANPAQMRADHLDVAERILVQWKSDLTKRINAIPYHAQSILTQSPSQTVLRGVGRILGGIGHANTIKADQYRRYLMERSYEDIVAAYHQVLIRDLQAFTNVFAGPVTSMFEPYFNQLAHFRKEVEASIQQEALTVKDLLNHRSGLESRLKVYLAKTLQLELALGVE